MSNETTASAIEEGRKMMSDSSAPRYSSMDARECHIESDWILIHEIRGDVLECFIRLKNILCYLRNECNSSLHIPVFKSP